MTDDLRLALVRGLHTAIYLVMAGAVFIVLYAGITGAHGPWLWAAVGLVAVECLVFVASGMKCPLTAVAVKYGATRNAPRDTYLPERFTRLTFRIFTPLIVLGALLVVGRMVWFGWAPA
ncbi:MAG: hypothetical protein Q7T23_03970 [Phenylobacterium sp.]|nr:hypothetical protein [Phenylobacterium sp.]